MWPGGEFPRGVDDPMETPVWADPCGGKRRALGWLRPPARELSNAAGTWKARRGV